MTERFLSGSWSASASGAPILDDALASFDGIIDKIIEVGTHSMVLCAITGVHIGRTGEALLYVRRGYPRLLSEEPPTALETLGSRR